MRRLNEAFRQFETEASDVARRFASSSLIVVGFVCVSMSQTKPVMAGRAILWQDEVGQAEAVEQVRRWVQQLDSTSFQEREVATRRLMEAGVSSLRPLAEAVTHRSAEVRVRALEILESHAASSDWDLQLAARDMIEEILKEAPAQTAHAIRSSLVRIDELRAERTLAWFISKGAIPERAPFVVDGQIREGISSLTIKENWQGTSEDLERLSWLEEVRTLVLEGRQIKDSTIEAALQIEGLSILEIKDADISPRIFETVPESTAASLLSLTIKYSPVNDETLEDVEGFQRLQILALYGTEATRERLAEYEARHRSTEVDYRMGGFLGVRGVTEPLSGFTESLCRISEVVAGSAAEKAGLRVDDVVIEANGREVRGIEELIDVARPLVPGDKIELSLLRDDKPVETTLILGRWE